MALNLKRIEAICFDVDGTLRDTDDQYAEKFERLLRPFRWMFKDRDHVPVARRLVMSLETPVNKVYALPDKVHLDDEVARMEAWLHRLRGGKPEETTIIPGVSQMLDVLAAHYPLAVVSARGRRKTVEFLEQHHLLPYFSAIATGQSARYTKPMPDPIFWAAEQIGVDAVNCLMVGDTTVDIIAGKAAGTQTVGVLCGFGESEELEFHGADVILETTADLVGTLGK